jgi:hypothetical protein
LKILPKCDSPAEAISKCTFSSTSRFFGFATCRIGYARVWTDDQTLDLQRDALGGHLLRLEGTRQSGALHGQARVKSEKKLLLALRQNQEDTRHRDGEAVAVLASRVAGLARIGTPLYGALRSHAAFGNA